MQPISYTPTQRRLGTTRIQEPILQLPQSQTWLWVNLIDPKKPDGFIQNTSKHIKTHQETDWSDLGQIDPNLWPQEVPVPSEMPSPGGVRMDLNSLVKFLGEVLCFLPNYELSYSSNGCGSSLGRSLDFEVENGCRNKTSHHC